MRRKLSVGLMVAAVTVAVAGGAFAQHQPITGNCPSGAAQGAPFTPLPPSPGNFDFCGALDTLFCSLAPVGALLPEILEFADLVRCSTADINGPLNLEAEIPVTGNGIPDGQFELGVIAAVLNDTGYDQNGLTHGEVLTAFGANFDFFKDIVITALTEEGFIEFVPLLAPNLIDSLSYALAGYAVIGDENTMGALVAVFELLGDIGIDPPTAEDLATIPGFFGPGDDLAGSGATNFTHFAAFGADGPAAYIAAVLDPNIVPEIPEDEVVVRIIAPGKVEVGTTIEMRSVITGLFFPPTFEWRKDGVALAGQTGSSVVLGPLTIDDAGFYQLAVTFDDGTKATTTVLSPAFNLQVLPEGALPVSGGLGLGLLAGAFALAGAAGIRRRKK